MSPASERSAGQAKASLFEGIFGELKPTGAFANELAAAGWDPGRPQLSYPQSVFEACLHVAARHCYPLLPEKNAMFELGRVFTRGFGRTAVGKIALAVVPALSPGLLIDYLPKIIRLTASGSRPAAVTVHVVGSGERERLVDFSSAELTPMPDFMAGGIAEVNKALKVQVAGRRQDGYTLKIAW